MYSGSCLIANIPQKTAVGSFDRRFYRTWIQITSSTIAPTMDIKNPAAGWNGEPSFGLEISRASNPPATDPNMPRMAVAKKPMCWAPGTIARAISPTTNPTMIDQRICNICRSPALDRFTPAIFLSANLVRPQSSSSRRRQVSLPTSPVPSWRSYYQ